MPTIAQLVRNGRTDKIYKSKAPYLSVGYNSLKKKETNLFFLNLKVLKIQ